jgi:RimJ/RimL family protein N-acetyltransferase
MRVPALPPERVDLNGGGADDPAHLVLRRLTVADAAAVATAVAENLEHLRPWMPWADADSANERFQRRRIAEADTQWARGADFGYGLFADDDRRLLGAFGLTARRGPRTLEIGYWLRADVTGRGLATRAVEALTDVAVNQPGVERVLVYCDEANHASAAIPRRLGYRLDRIVAVPPEATAETGRQLEWVVRPTEWHERRGAVDDVEWRA